MKLYFAMRKNDGKHDYISVISKSAERCRDDNGVSYKVVDFSSGLVQIIRAERVGTKHDQCAIGFSKEEAVMLFLDGVSDMAEFLEKKAVACRETLNLPVEDEC